MAVRLPKVLVDQLVLKPGDEIKIITAKTGTLEIARDDVATRRAEALKRMSERRWKLPEGYKFDRDKANSRR